MIKKISLLAVSFVFATCISANALTLTLNPVGGAISGTPGSTIGWGYTVVNDSGTEWVTLGAGSTFNTPETWGTYTDFTAANFTVLAPGASFTQSFDSLLLTGVGSLYIDPLATPGWIASGSIDLTYNHFDGDPNFGGNDLGTLLASTDAMVTVMDESPVPEPGTIMLLGSGLMGMLPFRRRLMGNLA